MTAAQPSHALGDLGCHPVVSLNRWFETRSERNITENDAGSSRITDRSVGDGTPSASASASTYSPRGSGRSSTTLYTPLGASSAAVTADAASSVVTDER